MMKFKFCFAYLFLFLLAYGNAQCLPSLTLQSNEQYLFTAWVSKPGVLNESSYDGIGVRLKDNNSTIKLIFPSGEIIDGWQKIEGTFIAPELAKTPLKVIFINDDSEHNIAIDDIRIIPFDASMLSYVYDPTSFKLVAELDENHYAKFYDYDAAGKLTRIRKETERGVKTLMESRIYIK